MLFPEICLLAVSVCAQYHALIFSNNELKWGVPAAMGQIRAISACSGVLGGLEKHKRRMESHSVSLVSGHLDDFWRTPHPNQGLQGMWDEASWKRFFAFYTATSCCRSHSWLLEFSLLVLFWILFMPPGGSFWKCSQLYEIPIQLFGKSGISRLGQGRVERKNNASMLFSRIVCIF